ncbi:MAG: glucose-6-phosphate isomerase [Acidimicrobiia bacterium]
MTASIPADTAQRIWARDDSLWAKGEDRSSDRLGWLDLPKTMRAELPRLQELTEQVTSEGFRTIALLGMGGSSLAPELYASVLRSADYPDLVVADSTHPDQVHQVTNSVELDHTLFCVASKSGTTAETLALYRHFRALVPDGRHYVAITDPETPLAALAREESFRALFVNPPDVGGRYSALSLFGLLPAALVGADVQALLDSSAEEAGRTRDPASPALSLGSQLATAVAEGRDKLTISTSPTIHLFGDWVEQLLAESTGKHGTGIVPIVSEPPLDDYGPDRMFATLQLAGEGIASAAVHRQLRSPEELGAEIYHWEFATAAAGLGLGINPFDQPDVEAAKRAARAALEQSAPPPWPDDDPDELFSGLAPPSYAAILAFAPVTRENKEIIAQARLRLGTEHGVATGGAFGPRYLHSSGQLHKGGPKRLRALVVLAEHTEDLPIPGQEHTFGRLVAAQAAGDAEALEAAGQKVARVGWDGFADWVGT